MKFLFDDPSFDFEALRTVGHAVYGGADIGEVLVTCREIAEGDTDSWHAAWAATGFHAAASQADTDGRTVDAHEAYLRATNYYRTADFYRREDPSADPESARLSGLARDTFARAMELGARPATPLTIPYEGKHMYAYWFEVDDSGETRPTVIYHGGFDSTLEETYFFAVEAALRRGFNVLAFEGPGQGRTLRDQGLPFTADWHRPVAAAIDAALAQRGVDPENLVLFGTSLGGVLAARAAAFEDRIRAVVLHDGVWDFQAAHTSLLPGYLSGWIEEGRDDLANPVLATLMAGNTNIRWALQNGRWTFGAEGLADYIRKTAEYSMADVVDRIDVPTLVCSAEVDHFFQGQPEQVFAALNCEKEFLHFPENEGAGEHCHEGGHLQFHPAAFAWVERQVTRS